MRKEKTMKDKGFAVCMAVLWSIVMANAFSQLVFRDLYGDPFRSGFWPV